MRILKGKQLQGCVYQLTIWQKSFPKRNSPRHFPVRETVSQGAPQSFFIHFPTIPVCYNLQSERNTRERVSPPRLPPALKL